MHRKQLRILAGQRGCGTRTAVKKRELADHVAGFIFSKNKFLAVSTFNKKLDTARAQDKNLPANIAVVKNGFAFFEVAAIHHLGQRFTLLVVKKAEDRHFSNH